MTKWIGAALLAAAVMVGGFAGASPVKAETVRMQAAQSSLATDISARKHDRHYRRYASRPYPMYYGRPVTYAPAPFFPIPPLWGYGWEWW